MLDVLKMYDVGVRMLNGVNILHKDANAIKVNKERSESFGI